MRILFPGDQREADRLTCAGQGISSLELMERAVSALSEAIRRRFPCELSDVLVVCGPGNNGGDGLALARQLSADGRVSVFMSLESANGSPDQQHMLQRLPENVRIIRGLPVDFRAAVSGKSLLVDALFGAGLNRPLTGSYAELVAEMNLASCIRIAVDTPSGLLCPMPTDALAFCAHHVFTFHSPKPAFLLPESERFVPDFSVLDINLMLPPEKKGDFQFIEQKDAAFLIRPRSKFAHKGTFGHALLLAGSEGKIGAAVLASRACLRSGAGLVSVQVPACGRDVLQSVVPEAMVIPDKGNTFLRELKDMAPYSAIGIGPGIGQHPETAELLRNILKINKPLVLDADALNLLAYDPELLRSITPGSVLTPHPKEFARLCGFSGSAYNRWFAAREFAEKHGVYLILKGAYSLICTPEGRAWFNSSGNAGMAKGGSGDVLTGLLTGLIASGYSHQDACKLGVYLHGLAGDLAAQSLGSIAMNAGDVVDSLPEAWRIEDSAI